MHGVLNVHLPTYIRRNNGICPVLLSGKRRIVSISPGRTRRESCAGTTYTLRPVPNVRTATATALSFVATRVALSVEIVCKASRIHTGDCSWSYLLYSWCSSTRVYRIYSPVAPRSVLGYGVIPTRSSRVRGKASSISTTPIFGTQSVASVEQIDTLGKRSSIGMT
jgi:hypothetical protein